jgi:hypothetical protein
MPIDPRMFAPFDLGEIMERQQRAQYNQARIQEYQDERADKKQLRDLLPGAVKGDRTAIDRIAGIDPQMFMKLDEHQRKKAEEELGDLSAAVRWADSPEKWQYVQQHYGQKGIDLSPYRFEDRERGLVALGKMGGYLKDPPKPDIRATEPGGGLYAINPDGSVRVLVQPNDGSAPMGQPAPQSGGVQEGATATNPQTGQKIIYRGGQWVPVGGAGSNAGGNFPPSGS